MNGEYLKSPSTSESVPVSMWLPIAGAGRGYTYW